MASTSERAKKHVERWRRLAGRRGTWEYHWDQIARVALPRRLGFVSQEVPGAPRNEDIYDNSAMIALRALANAMGTLLRPDGQAWFHIRPADHMAQLDDAAEEWLDEAERLLQQALADPKSRFRQAAGECDADLVAFGTGAVYVGAASEWGRLSFQTLHLKDAFPMFDPEGVAIGIYITREYAVWQLVQEFGLENVSEGVREAWEKERIDEMVSLLQCVVPRAIEDIVKPETPSPKRRMPYHNLWYEVDRMHELRDGGFPEFPFAVPRWDTSSGEDYGRSPAMIALPDANTAQAIGETLLVAGQRAADPPMAVPHDGSFSEVNTFPGGLITYDPDIVAKIGRNPYFTLDTSGNMPLTRELLQDTRENIQNAFLRNILNLPVDRPQMTATEVRVRQEEFLREIGPVFGRLETDYTAPLVEKAFKAMLRGKFLPPLPPSLMQAGSAVRFEYESPVKRIRQEVEARKAQEWVLEAFQLAEVDPSALDIIDLDEYQRHKAEAFGLPGRMVKGREAVAAKREQREQAMERKAQLEQMAAQVQGYERAAGAADRGMSALERMNKIAATGPNEPEEGARGVR